MNKKRTIWITSLLCLLPMILSAVVYSRLPDKMAIHWDVAGVADNHVHKAIAAFGMPIVFLIINLLLSKMRLLGDPKGEGQSRANAGGQILTWITPALSVILVPIMLCIAMGVDISMVMVGSLLVGLVLIVFGNYLPKSRQNDFIGIKLPWTLNDTDNWNKTHRLAGYVYIVCGALLIIANLLLDNRFAYISVDIIIIAALALIPIIYSYSLYRRKSN